MHAQDGVADVPAPALHEHMNPIVLGTICGFLHAVGPDHLATLVTFSALMDPWAAAKVGAAWGAGHCAGIIAVAFLVLCLARLPGVHMENWEYYGDYAIGVSMIIVSLYFIFREGQFVVTMEDGRVDVKVCACHGPRGPVDKGSKRVARKRKGHQFCSEFSKECKDPDCHSDDEESPPEAMPLIPFHQLSANQIEHNRASTQGKDVQSALVGLLQGMCCPMGLVGMGFAAGRSPLEIAIMTITTVAVSIGGTASVAASWAYFTRSMGNVNPKFVYRASCLMGLMLGVLWISANYLGVLDKLNYAEGHITLAVPNSEVKP
eukprot:TRINITY_DN22400_c0_g1_i1.p1 TRINITY_DN22400_c0_g1~~TRINITY_DN22400_c0_g1_i1.p1  ORF type:complete len:319 (-),score=51.06 TRINITY_DN22400_c0_g1_i1:51-1007(-)